MHLTNDLFMLLLPTTNQLFETLSVKQWKVQVLQTYAPSGRHLFNTLSEPLEGEALLALLWALKGRLILTVRHSYISR